MFIRDLLIRVFQRDRLYRFPYRSSFPARRTHCLWTNSFGVKGKAAHNRRGYVSRSIPGQLAHDESVVTPIVCQSADIDRRKHLLANVEAVINATATCNSEGPTRVFSLLTEGVKAIRPGYAARLTYVETSRTWGVHDNNCDEVVADTTATETPRPFAAW